MQKKETDEKYFAKTEVTPSGGGTVAASYSESVLTTEDILSVGGVSIATSAFTSAVLDNGRRQSFGGIMAGMSAPMVAGQSIGKSAAPAAPVDMEKFGVSHGW